MKNKNKKAIAIIIMETMASIGDNVAAAELGGFVVDLYYHALGATLDAVLAVSFVVTTVLSIAIKAWVNKRR